MSDKAKICRLCLKNDKFSVSIFNNYLKEKNIQLKIEEYLHIQINSSDNITKYICYKCLSKLDDIKKFADASKQSQTILQNKNNSSESLFEDIYQTSPNVKQNRKQNNVEDKSKCENDNKSTESLFENSSQISLNGEQNLKRHNLEKASKKCSKEFIKDSNDKTKPIQYHDYNGLFKIRATPKFITNTTFTEKKPIAVRKQMLSDYYNQKCKMFKKN